jgi:hypothetical protein
MSRYRLNPAPAQEAVLRDHCGHAMAAFYDPGNPAGRPSWRKAGRNEGFRIVGRGPQRDVRRVSRHVGEVRESQAVFGCTACGFTANADVNAAINIAAGHPTHLPIPLHARGGDGVARPVNREPHLLLHSG